MVAKPRPTQYRLLITTLLVAGLAVGFYGLHQRIVAAESAYTYRDGRSRLVRTASGQLWDTHFRHPPKEYGHRYTYNGSEQPNRRFVTWTRGVLGIGVNQASEPTFRGFFAMTNPTFPAGSFVQTSMDPMRIVAGHGQLAETIIAVQTATTDENGQINYVIASLTQSHRPRTRLQLGYANGVVKDARTYILKNYSQTHLLSAVAHEPLTVSTNGRNLLRIWLGGHLILHAQNLSLHILPPFQIYLEVQSRERRYVARFRSLLVYRSNQVTLNGLPRGTTVQVNLSNGARLAGGAARRGRFVVSLTPPHLAYTATIKIYRHGRMTIFRGVSLQGGDVYHYRD